MSGQSGIITSRQKFSKLKEATRPKEIIDQLQREFAYLSHETVL
ncbi:MAG: hypothetical protein R3C26_25920 [Calditrichia bacterium]